MNTFEIIYVMGCLNEKWTNQTGEIWEYIIDNLKEKYQH